MNKDVKKYVIGCDSCQRNKSSNQQPAGLLQPLAIPYKRCEQITMDFIVQLPLTQQVYDAIVVFVDGLTKRAHFCQTHTSVTATEVAKIYFDNNSKQYSTGFTPFELDCGQHPNTPVSIAAKKQTQLPAVDDFLHHWDTMIQVAKDTLMIAQERQAKYANQHRRYKEYKIGDKIL